MTPVYVTADMPILVEHPDGSRTQMWPVRNGWDAIPADVYRMNAHQGVFRRRLRRVARFGREFWMDKNWEDREAMLALMRGAHPAGSAAVEVAPPAPRRSGCGCGGKSG